MTIATATNILCERTGKPSVPVEQSIHACAAAGFTELDFGFAELVLEGGPFLGDGWRGEISRYACLARELGVRFVQGHAAIYDFYGRSSDGYPSVELLRRSIEGARILGIPWLAVHPSGPGAVCCADVHGENVRFFRDLADYARDFHVGLAIENMWGKYKADVPRYAIRAEEMKLLIRDIDRKNVGVCWDVEHASVEKLPQGNSIRLLGSHIKATHISDETGAENIHILPYTGLVAWDEILRAFADIGYQGAFALEIQHFTPGMPDSLLPHALRFAYETGTRLVTQFESYRSELPEKNETAR